MITNTPENTEHNHPLPFYQLNNDELREICKQNHLTNDELEKLKNLAFNPFSQNRNG